MSGCANRGAVIAIIDHLVELAEGVGLRPTEVERLIGVHRGIWPLSPRRRALWWPTAEQAERVGELHGLLVGIVAVMGRDAGRAWLRGRNPGLGATPVCFMLSGADGLAKLCRILAREESRC